MAVVVGAGVVVAVVVAGVEEVVVVGLEEVVVRIGAAGDGVVVVLKEVADGTGVVDMDEVVDDAVVVVVGAGVVVVFKGVVVEDGVVVVFKGVVVGDGVVVVVKGVVVGDGVVVVIKGVVVGDRVVVVFKGVVVEDGVVVVIKGVVVGDGVVVVIKGVVVGGGVVVVITEAVVVVAEVLEGTGVVVMKGVGMEEVVILAAVVADPFALDENGAGVDTTAAGDVKFVPFPPPWPDCELASRRNLRTWRASVLVVPTLLTCAPDTLSSNTNSTASASVHATHDRHRNLFTFLCFLGMPRRIPGSHGLYTRPLCLAVSRCFLSLSLSSPSQMRL